jgi:hypothetical protein
MDELRIILIAAGATVALYALPGVRVLARPLVLIATLVHELGHGLAAMLLGGSFERLQLWADGSGVAVHRGHYSVGARALVSAAGPLGPPLAAVLLFWCGGNAGWASATLVALAGLALVVALVFVRNLFGFVFVLAVGATLALVAAFASVPAAQVACAFLAIQMSVSTFARADYLFKAHARTTLGLVPSDTAQIAAALGMPHWFWGVVLALASLALLLAGAWLFGGTASAS